MTKTIEIQLTIESGRDNYELCEAIEQVLLGSSLNNSEFKLNIIETKVIKSEENTNEKQLP